MRAPAGSSFFTPGTEPHTFSNLDGPPARLLVVALPGGFEAFFREMAALADADELDRDAVLALNAKHGVTTA